MKAEGALKETFFVLEKLQSFYFLLFFIFFNSFPVTDFHVIFASLGIDFSLPLVEERKRSNELEPQEDKEEKEKAEE